MTAVQQHPLSAALARVSELDEYLAADLGTPEGDDWIVATDFASVLPDCLRRIGDDLRTDDRRIHASMFIWSYAWRVAAPAIACYLAERRVPDVASSNVAVRFDAAGVIGAPAFLSSRFAELATDSSYAPGAVPLVDSKALRSWLRMHLEHHLALTVAALCACSPLGTRAQWALAADGCASAFLHAGKKLGCEADSCREASAFLPTSGSPLRSRATFHTLTHAGRCETHIRRASCCLYYKLDGQVYCTGCPLLSETEFKRRVRVQMEESSSQEDET